MPYFLRCLTCIEAGQDGNIVITVHGGKWFEAKAQHLLNLMSTMHCAASSTASQGLPPILPVTGWKDFPSCVIPSQFCYGNIYRFLIATSNLMNTDENGDSDENSADVSVSKPMHKGRQYFLSGHVTNIEDMSQPTHYFMKAGHHMHSTATM